MALGFVLENEMGALYSSLAFSRKVVFDKTASRAPREKEKKKGGKGGGYEDPIPCALQTFQ